MEETRNVDITSGARNPAQNAAAHGAKASEHLVDKPGEKANAIDLQTRGMTDDEKRQYVVDIVQSGAKRVIAYSDKDIIHVDMKGGSSQVAAMYDGSKNNMHRAPDWYTGGLEDARMAGANIAVDDQGGEDIGGGTTTPDTASSASKTPEERAAADTTARSGNTHPVTNTTPGSTAEGYYSNITQRGLGTDLKPTRPPTGVSAEDYKRSTAGQIGAAGIDMLSGASGFGTIAQVLSFLTTGDSVGGNIVDNFAGQGATNYYQPGSLDRQSDSSGEQVRTDPTQRFADKYLTGGSTSTGTTTATPVVATSDVAPLPFYDPTVRPTPLEKWGPKQTWVRS
jgi:hypothetical protein